VITTMPTYKEEVLGEICIVLFQVDGGASAPFEGKIQTYKAELQEDGSVERSHFVVFDDGDERWFDLEVESEENRLWWTNLARGGPAPATAAAVLSQEEDTKPAPSAAAKKNTFASLRPAKRRAPPVTPERPAKVATNGRQRETSGDIAWIKDMDMASSGAAWTKATGCFEIKRSIGHEASQKAGLGSRNWVQAMA
jgi:hypothetical protein